MGHRDGDFPVTEKVMREIISLPMYPELSAEQIEYVADTVKTFVRGE
jgi:dTDP-4-amino-4,6-dideoxygalactose transaminase